MCFIGTVSLHDPAGLVPRSLLFFPLIPSSDFGCKYNLGGDMSFFIRVMIRNKGITGQGHRTSLLKH